MVEGQTATFYVIAEGTGLTYQWYINRNQGAGWKPIDGATGASYTTSVLKKEYDGFQYGCLITDATGAVMQSAHMMPDWIPVWFLGVLAWNHSVVRAPDLHPNVLFFLRDAGATTASSIPADLLRDKGPLLMLIWVVTGYMSGEWLSLNAGMTGFILMTFFVSTFRIIRMMNGNLEAFDLVGEKVMEIAEDARADLAAQAREEQACREDEGS